MRQSHFKPIKHPLYLLGVKSPMKNFILSRLNFISTKFLKAILIVVLAVALGLLITSCRRNMPRCTKNCVDISISGKVSLKTSGAALQNLPVELTWYQKHYCIICSSLKVSKTTTNADGSFTFNATIDTSLFNTYYLAARVTYDTSKYIGDPRDHGGFNTNYLLKRFYNLATLSSPAQFEFYPRTSLTINLHRVLNDDFNYFQVRHSYNNVLVFGDYSITSQQFAKDTAIRTTTSTDSYTKIFWTKRSGTGPFIEKSDSILCTLNGPNVIDINY